MFLLQNKNWNLIGFPIIVNICTWIKTDEAKSCTAKVFTLWREWQYTWLFQHLLVSLTTTFRVFVFLVLAFLTPKCGPCLKSSKKGYVYQWFLYKYLRLTFYTLKSWKRISKTPPYKPHYQISHIPHLSSQILR